MRHDHLHHTNFYVASQPKHRVRPCFAAPQGWSILAWSVVVIGSLISLISLISLNALLLATASAQTGAATGAASAVTIGSRRELFLDSTLIASLKGVRLQLERPRAREVVLRFDKPWEGGGSGYGTILADSNPFSSATTATTATTAVPRFTMTYRGAPVLATENDLAQVVCLAESHDGIVWTKPALTRFSAASAEDDGASGDQPSVSVDSRTGRVFAGGMGVRPPSVPSGASSVSSSVSSSVALPAQEGDKTALSANIILRASEIVTAENFTPLLDTRPGVPLQERYKALAGSKERGLWAYGSADGVTWRVLQGNAVIRDGVFDSQNVAFWSSAEQRYVCFFRVYGGAQGAVRGVARTTSQDFRTWTTPVVMTMDNLDARSENLYLNQTQPYFRAPHIYVGLAARFFENKQPLSTEALSTTGVVPDYAADCSETVLVSTRAGSTTYNRTFMEGFVSPTTDPKTWTSRTNFSLLGLHQTSATEMSFYVQRNFAQPDNCVQRHTLRLDGFASVVADASGGEFVTKAFVFDGAALALNFASAAAGYIRVELQSPDGKPLPGFELDSTKPLVGNAIDFVLPWREPFVRALAGKPVRLRFVMRNAKLFSFQFR
jgi:hypothetical protein